jgi:GTPase SAR1 family protein
VKEECNPEAVVILVGNKKDVLDEEGEGQRQVSQDMITKFKEKFRVVKDFEVSAKSGENVFEVYSQLAKFLFEQHKESINKETDDFEDEFGRASQTKPKDRKKKKGCC